METPSPNLCRGLCSPRPPAIVGVLNSYEKAYIQRVCAPFRALQTNQNPAQSAQVIFARLLKPQPSRDTSFLLTGSRGPWSLVGSKGKTLGNWPLTLKRALLRKHFSRFLRKMRRAQPSRASFLFCRNEARIMHSPCEKTTPPKTGAI